MAGSTLEEKGTPRDRIDDPAPGASSDVPVDQAAFPIRSIEDARDRPEPVTGHAPAAEPIPFAAGNVVYVSDRTSPRLPTSAASGLGRGPTGTRRSVNGRADLLRGGRRLFTATLVDHGPVETLYAFEAMMAHSHAEARKRLSDRRGARQAALASVMDGFDPGSTLVLALVSDAAADMLSDIAADPGSILADGLEFKVEQRFDS